MLSSFCSLSQGLINVYLRCEHHGLFCMLTTRAAGWLVPAERMQFESRMQQNVLIGQLGQCSVTSSPVLPVPQAERTVELDTHSGTSYASSAVLAVWSTP
jgi:hypothetical protein